MELEQERAAQRAEELHEELRADAERQQCEREAFQKARRRAMSDATEMPPSEEVADVTPIETFQEEIQWQGVSFMSVKLFHPQKGAFCSTLNALRMHCNNSYRMSWQNMAGGTYH